MRLQREAFNGRQLSLKPRMEQALAFIIATDVFKPNWECHSHKYNLSYSETGHLQMSVYFLTASKPPFTPLFHSFTFTLTPLTSLITLLFFLHYEAHAYLYYHYPSIISISCHSRCVAAKQFGWHGTAHARL
jgi:hypothetical protein